MWTFSREETDKCFCMSARHCVLIFGKGIQVNVLPKGTETAAFIVVIVIGVVIIVAVISRWQGRFVSIVHFIHNILVLLLLVLLLFIIILTKSYGWILMEFSADVDNGPKMETN